MFFVLWYHYFKKGENMDKIIIKNKGKIIESLNDLTTYDVNYNTLQVPVHVLCNDERYVIHPVFQRHFVWNKEQKSELIKSILRGMPIPNIYTYLEHDSDKELVIDGQQRLTTIKKFINDKLKLSGPKNDNLTGFDFFMLPDNLKNRIMNYKLSITQINNLNNERILFDIYRRFNSGATKLSPQELRHCVCQGKFNSLIQELAKYEPFKKCFETKEIDRMEKEEYILRFFTLYEDFGNYHANMNDVLNKYAEKKMDMNSLSDEMFTVQTKDMVLKFKKSVDMCVAVFGNNTFKNCDNKNRAHKINYKSLSKSVYDMQMLGFADFDSDLIIRHKDNIKQRYEHLVLNDENMRPFYKKASKKATIFRINEWKKEIAQIVNL